MSYCGQKNRDGFLCILQAKHNGQHLSIDNTKLWKGTPGAPVVWGKSKKNEPRIDPTLTQAEYARSSGYTGDTCSYCGGMRMRRNGTCQLCEDCGQTTGCS